MIKHLLKDYNNLLDIETILIAGGTGGICYKYMTELKKMGYGHLLKEIQPEKKDDNIGFVVYRKHVIDQTKCIKCGKCLETCKFGAIEKE